MTDANVTPQVRTAMRRGTKGSLAAVAAVAVVGLIAAACGSSTPSASPTTLAKSPANASPTTKPATSQTVVNAESNTTIGSSILVTTTGKTLYTLSSDTAGMSSCTGACATAWPPLTVSSGVSPKGGTAATGTLATITRSDGSLQVTYNGMPLYTFAGDSAAGSTSGNGVKDGAGTWSVVKVGAATSLTPATTAPKPVVPKTPTTMAPTTTAPSGGGYGY
jgi:predicted lipoprotein with Yx(FWY)xxD motif